MKTMPTIMSIICILSLQILFTAHASAGNAPALKWNVMEAINHWSGNPLNIEVGGVTSLFEVPSVKRAIVKDYGKSTYLELKSMSAGNIVGNNSSIPDNMSDNYIEVSGFMPGNAQIDFVWAVATKLDPNIFCIVEFGPNDSVSAHLRDDTTGPYHVDKKYPEMSCNKAMQIYFSN